jgi:hypothetical protein
MNVPFFSPMRRHYGWWCFWAAILGSVAGVVGLVMFMCLPRQPQDVTDLLEKLQLGLDHVEVTKSILGHPPRGFAGFAPGDLAFINCRDGWRVRIELGRDSKLIDKRPIAPEAFWRRTWSYWRERIPSLPDLPI